MSRAVVSAEGLRKTYRDVVAVEHVDFEVARGEIFGLLGPNGAGKTTTLECLEGLRRPDSGRLEVMGIDPSRSPRHLNRVIGVQLQSAALPPTMTPVEAMRFFCSYHAVEPRYDLLDRLGLSEKVDSRYELLSTGQQRRLALALAAAHGPPVLILDEPTAGLDVASRSELHTLMGELKNTGTTILLATHDMAEAEKLADRVAILLEGRIVATDTPRNLTATGSGATKVSVRSVDMTLYASEVSFPFAEKRPAGDGYAVYFTTDPGATVAAILSYLAELGDTLVDLRVERPTLEERFLEITGGGR